MTIAGKRKINLSEIKQEIDLEKYLGSEPTKTQKIKFANLAQELINQRTLGGKDVDGKKFVKYSKQYADKKGVSVNSVDMFLEGDMLDSIKRDKESEKETTVVIAIDSDQVEKSYNHIVGDTVPERDWFGITDSEAKRIAKEIKSDAPKKKTKKRTLISIREEVEKLEFEVE